MRNEMLKLFSDEIIVKEMLERLGENTERPGLVETPKRIVKMWKEIYRGYNNGQKPNITTFKNGVDGFKTDEMIKDCGTFYSTCEHHFLPFFGQYWFAYIPNPDEQILGISKVARVVEYFAAKAQIQERLVEEVVADIEEALTVDNIKPFGIALVMNGKHLCKVMRGVKNNGNMETTKLTGAFKEDAKTRAEFMNWVNK